MTAIQAISAISNWLYWQKPKAGSETSLDLTHFTWKFNEPDLDKLRDAVEAGKRAKDFNLSNKQPHQPKSSKKSIGLPSSSPETNSSTITSEAIHAPPPTPNQTKSNQEVTVEDSRQGLKEKSLAKTLIPFAAGLVAAIYVRTQVDESQYGMLEHHIAGSLVLDIANSFWLQTVLVGVTWYCIGLYFIELVEALGRTNWVSGKGWLPCTQYKHLL